MTENTEVTCLTCIYAAPVQARPVPMGRPKIGIVNGRDASVADVLKPAAVDPEPIKVISCRRYPPQIVVLPVLGHAQLDPKTRQMHQSMQYVPSPLYPQVQVDNPCGEHTVKDGSARQLRPSE